MLRTASKSEYMKRRYEIQRRFFIELLGGACRKCGSTVRLEIDHIDPSQKTMDMSQLRGKKSIIAAIVELVTKCQVLCHRHHVAKTVAEFRVARVKPVSHGTMYAWMKLKCGCETCSDAKWSWHDARNAKRSAAFGIKQRGPYKKTRFTGSTVTHPTVVKQANTPA